jgi:hypothetical protein
LASDRTRLISASSVEVKLAASDTGDTGPERRSR